MKLIRPLVQKLQPYVPGEQPRIKGLIKLNTNESPYAPSPKVLKAVKKAVDGRLRLYPNPTSELLREKLAALHGCAPENIIVGNGSDELLAMATRAFAEPGTRGIDSMIQYLSPCYSLYPVLAAIHGSHVNDVVLPPDYSLPTPAELKRAGRWDFKAALTFLTTPNAPTGTGYANETLNAFCRSQKGVTILDEAYVDFADQHAMPLALEFPHVLVARTFSKSYSLCFQRVGYFVGHPKLIEALHKIKDSYNVNGLGQVAACATLDDLPYYQRNIQKIRSTRQWLTDALSGLGFVTHPSQTNFIFVKPPRHPAQEWHQKLRDAKVLVRWFSLPQVRDFLRITIGTDAEARTLVKAAKAIL